MARPSPLGMPAWASRLCVVSPRPPRQVRQRAQVEDLEGLRGPHGKPGSEGQAVCSQGEWLAEQAKGQAGSACVGAEGRVPGCPCRTLRVLGQTPQGFASATSLPRTRRLGSRAGLGWEEVKQNEGRGRAGGCPWGLVGRVPQRCSCPACRFPACRGMLALSRVFLPPPACISSAVSGHQPHGSPCPDPGGLLVCVEPWGLRGADPLAGTSLRWPAQLRDLASPIHRSSPRDAPAARVPTVRKPCLPLPRRGSESVAHAKGRTRGEGRWG